MYDRIVQVVYHTGGIGLYDIAMMILTIFGIGLAAHIGYKQLKISKRQIELSNEQGKIIDKQTNLLDRQNNIQLYALNVDRDKYTIDVLLQNIQENLHKIYAIDILLQKDPSFITSKEGFDKLKQAKKDGDDGLITLYATLHKAMDNYKETMENVPDGTDMQEKPHHETEVNL